jgi:hypothetical protein
MARAASPRPPSPPFSVPKSGSCGLPPPRGESFRLADGNAEILGYLKRHGTSSRQGANAASDRGNQTSRAGDPAPYRRPRDQCRMRDRRRLVGRRGLLIYLRARTGGFVYQAAVRARFVNALGVSFAHSSRPAQLVTLPTWSAKPTRHRTGARNRVFKRRQATQS